MKYLVVIEETVNGYSAYSPDLPGCAGVGRTVEEAEQDVREAIALHVEGLRAEGCEVPRPTTRSTWVEVAA
ncbi:MAG: type II toxin-antitoxin system HicB family antitoxin [Myxococcota bacterium]